VQPNFRIDSYKEESTYLRSLSCTNALALTWPPTSKFPSTTVTFVGETGVRGDETVSGDGVEASMDEDIGDELNELDADEELEEEAV
jgi:hypothetical protein